MFNPCPSRFRPGAWFLYDYVHHVPGDLLNSQYECCLASIPCGGVCQADDVVVMTVNSIKTFPICEQYSKIAVPVKKIHLISHS